MVWAKIVSKVDFWSSPGHKQGSPGRKRKNLLAESPESKLLPCAVMVSREDRIWRKEEGQKTEIDVYSGQFGLESTFWLTDCSLVLRWYVTLYEGWWRLLVGTHVSSACILQLITDTKESVKGIETNINRVQSMLRHPGPPKASEHNLVPLKGAGTDCGSRLKIITLAIELNIYEGLNTLEQGKNSSYPVALQVWVCSAEWGTW